jgi:hypothetical protein
VDRHKLDVGFDMSQSIRNRFGSLAAPVDYVDPQDRHIRTKLRIEIFAIVRSNDNDRLLDVVPIEKPLRRMQPNGSVFEWGEWFLVMLVVKPATLSGSRHDHGERGHGVDPLSPDGSK